jgi:UDP-glucose 4-epimerase
VTGAAGFIGSNLVDRLLRDGHQVSGYDNFSTGQRQFIAPARQHREYHLIEGDLLDRAALAAAVRGHEIVFHLAANADVRFGTQDPSRDLQQNTIATFNVLEAMRAAGARRIVFSSTGSIYGDPLVFPTPEDTHFPVQTSFYGASKLAGEGLIQAYCSGFDFQAYIFRFVSILGPRYTHGHVLDFYRKLLANPSEIEVLGNGKQRKSFLHVDDCVAAMLLCLDKSRDSLQVFNLGTDEYCTVDQSLDWICQHLGCAPRRRYSGGDRGWIGDSPFIFLDTRKIRALGWRPSHDIRSSIVATVQYLQQNQWVLQTR